jgi:hypothetical protein
VIPDGNVPAGDVASAVSGTRLSAAAVRHDSRGLRVRVTLSAPVGDVSMSSFIVSGCSPGS